jgi:hypothetical protein
MHLQERPSPSRPADAHPPPVPCKPSLFRVTRPKPLSPSSVVGLGEKRREFLRHGPDVTRPRDQPRSQYDPSNGKSGPKSTPGKSRRDCSTRSANSPVRVLSAVEFEVTRELSGALVRTALSRTTQAFAKWQAAAIENKKTLQHEHDILSQNRQTRAVIQIPPLPKRPLTCKFAGFVRPPRRSRPV